jgi:uncharacterized protein (DUF2267 family)
MDGRTLERAAATRRRLRMSATGMAVFDDTVQKTNLWLKEIREELGLATAEEAYRALRAVLHTLRDRLIVEEAAALGAQLPMLLRGVYFEGWRPHGKPTKERHLAPFLEHVDSQYVGPGPVDAERFTRGVFAVLVRHMPAGQIHDIRQGLPGDIRALWPAGSGGDD